MENKDIPYQEAQVSLASKITNKKKPKNKSPTFGIHD